MTRTIRVFVIGALLGALVVPVSAQTTSVGPATRGENIVICLRDGREIRGRVDEWVGDIGFRLAPLQGAPYLIRPADVVSIYDATTNLSRGIPVRSRGGSHFRRGVLIGVLATAGVIFGIGAVIGNSSGHR